MKKTFPVNINGSIFYIDEDAYNLLNTYLLQLRNAFAGEDEREVVADIEARISELFNEIKSKGFQVITLDNVNSVIEQIGRPGDISDSDNSNAPTATPPPYRPQQKKLYRNMQNKVFGGVLSGIAVYYGWNTNILRLLVFFLSLCTFLWPLVVTYLIAWMVIPAANTPRQILEMQGEPVTLENIGQTIIGTADSVNTRNSNALQTILITFGKVILIFFGVIGAIITLATIGMFIKFICGIILLYGFGDINMLSDSFSFSIIENPGIGAIGGICLALAIALPAIALVWATCSVVFKIKGISRPILTVGIIIEILLIIAAIVLISAAKITFPDQQLMLIEIGADAFDTI